MDDFRKDLGRHVHVVQNKEPVGRHDRWIAIYRRPTTHVAIGSTQKKCIKAARRVARAKGVDLRIHGLDGEVRETISYT